jgi:hypothetical protein
MCFNLMSDAVGVVTKPIDEYKQSKALKQYSLNSGKNTTRLNPIWQGEESTDGLYLPGPSQPMAKTGSHTASAMAAASAKSLGNMIVRPYKSIFVDVPLAVADGLHAVPKLYGGEVRERGKITDLKSGTLVAGKSFVYGLSGGLADFVMEPYKGGKKEGALGVVKGIGKGSLSFVANAGSGK